MPPNVRNVNQVTSGFTQWWKSLPPITKWMVTIMVACSVGVDRGLLSANPFFFVIKLIYRKFEVWRLVTNFFLFGLNFQFVIQMIWLIQYGGQLETQTHQFEPADYLYMLIVNGFFCLVVDCLPFVRTALCGTQLVMSIIYVWSRNFPNQYLMIYGLVKLQSFYLPFAFTAISLLLKRPILPDIVGICVGHAYYYLHDIYPHMSGKHILQTPAFLKQWLADAGLRGAAPTPAEAQGAPQGFQAFRGGGRRLGDN